MPTTVFPIAPALPELATPPSKGGICVPSPLELQWTLVTASKNTMWQ